MTWKETSRDPEARKRFYRRFFLWIVSISLPLTGFLLWTVTELSSMSPHPDVPGLTAVSIGILGLLVFFIFYYKYQTYAGAAIRMRWILLVAHGGVIILLFVILIWMGFVAEWHTDLIWGSYSVEHAVRVWIIALIVIGVISLLGSLFDIIRTMDQGSPLPDQPEVKSDPQE